ncbi:hypothetical protein Pcinc_041064 [Petrolisthes cinctipes]|uniref:Peroxidase n=1 Tax=Petrolisthes cinctipes TaxID=88211 RepID=A0AAE1EHC2_PETCI|nr:hypothetical protein Pcinc_041064 [Petrolisthes cinctipes]
MNLPLCSTTLLTLALVVMVVVVVEGILRPGSALYQCRDPLQRMEIQEEDSPMDPLTFMDWPLKDGSWYHNKWNDHETRLSASNTSPETPSSVWANRHPEPLPHITHTATRVRMHFLAYETGLQNYQKQVELEAVLKEKNILLPVRSPAYTHHGRFRGTTATTNSLTRTKLGYIQDYTTRALVNRLGLESAATKSDLQFVDMADPRCVQKTTNLTCNPNAPFRTADGTCNNIDNPTWGASFTPFRRVAPHNYADGVSEMSVAQDGTALPGPRFISTSVNVGDENDIAPRHCLNILHMTFGQFVDHDITLAVPTTMIANDGSRVPIECCSAEVLSDPSMKHPACAPIAIPEDDHLYSSSNQTCLEFVRSAPADTDTHGPREQMNEVTHYLDVSQVYGSDTEATNLLRTGFGGLLLVTHHHHLSYPHHLPSPQHPHLTLITPSIPLLPSPGDERVNEQILLTLVHTTWLREHNRIARTLMELNPSWNDERLFQEARRIVVAETQHIAYNEFLPNVIGTPIMRDLELLPRLHGLQSTDYDPSLSPSISNEFATAAYRFGHSQIPDSINEGSSKIVSRSRELNSVLFNPFLLYEDGFEKGLLQGVTTQRPMRVDIGFTNQITGTLFRGETPFGLDLVAINLQRGRDHGLGTYMTVREACGLPRVTSYTDLAPFMYAYELRRLREVYSRVEDIELFVGGLSERPVIGGQVGPTFACILSDQFLRLKRGDRFWYEYRDSPNPFTRDQLRAIHRASMARVLCDNHPCIDSTQRWPLNIPSSFNPIISCNATDEFPKLDLSFWKE